MHWGRISQARDMRATGHITHLSASWEQWETPCHPLAQVHPQLPWKAFRWHLWSDLRSGILLFVLGLAVPLQWYFPRHPGPHTGHPAPLAPCFEELKRKKIRKHVQTFNLGVDDQHIEIFLVFPVHNPTYLEKWKGVRGGAGGACLCVCVCRSLWILQSGSSVVHPFFPFSRILPAESQCHTHVYSRPSIGFCSGTLPSCQPNPCTDVPALGEVFSGNCEGRTTGESCELSCSVTRQFLDPHGIDVFERCTVNVWNSVIYILLSCAYVHVYLAHIFWSQSKSPCEDLCLEDPSYHVAIPHAIFLVSTRRSMFISPAAWRLDIVIPTSVPRKLNWGFVKVSRKQHWEKNAKSCYFQIHQCRSTPILHACIVCVCVCVCVCVRAPLCCYVSCR